MLVQSRDQDGRPMSDREVRDACLAVFFAGHETTACLLAWTWYVLARHEDVETKILAELSRVHTGPGESPAALVRRLPYPEAVLNEVLPLSTPAQAFARRALRRTAVVKHDRPART